MPARLNRHRKAWQITLSSCLIVHRGVTSGCRYGRHSCSVSQATFYHLGACVCSSVRQAVEGQSGTASRFQRMWERAWRVDWDEMKPNATDCLRLFLLRPVGLDAWSFLAMSGVPALATGTCHVSQGCLNHQIDDPCSRSLFTWAGRRQRQPAQKTNPGIGACPLTGRGRNTGPQPSPAAWLDATSPLSPAIEPMA